MRESWSLGALEDIQYLPTDPESYAPALGVIGCGGISKHHLQAYRAAGYRVVALCDIDLKAAQRRAAEYFPNAQVFSDYHSLLRIDDIEVVDVTTHPVQRTPIIQAALQARKHVLSQKPFVVNLDQGHALVELAERQNCYLAVNQNGRWAPHFSYAREIAGTGAIGDVFGAHLSVHWDHSWVQGTQFEQVKHLILYDYAIHWFDILRCFFSGRALSTYASTSRVPGQTLMPDMAAQACIQFEDGQATLAFDAAVPFGSHEKTFLSGTRGSLHSFGTGNQEQTVYVDTERGRWIPRLQGQWFPDGFHGTMGELLCSIEQRRPCAINAADNLKSLELCFAAIHSAETGEPVVPGSVRQLPA